MKAYELLVHSAALSHLPPLRGWLCSFVVNRYGGTASDSLAQPYKKGVSLTVLALEMNDVV